MTAELARVPYSSPRMKIGATRRSNSMSLPRCGRSSSLGTVSSPSTRIRSLAEYSAADEFAQRARAVRHLRPHRAVEVRIRQSVYAGVEHARMRIAVRCVDRVPSPSHSSSDEAAVLIRRRSRPRTRGRRHVAAQKIRGQIAARTGRQRTFRRFGEIRHRGEAAGRRYTEPGSARGQVAAGEHVRRVGPALCQCRRTCVEFVAICRDDQRRVGTNPVCKQNQAHARMTFEKGTGSVADRSTSPRSRSSFCTIRTSIR